MYKCIYMTIMPYFAGYQKAGNNTLWHPWEMLQWLAAGMMVFLNVSNRGGMDSRGDLGEA